jgi:alkylhydroperoxidase family enzyme
MSLGDEVTEAVLTDWRSAPVGEKLRAALTLVEKLCRDPAAVSPADLGALRAAGASHEAIEDAIHVCAAFNVIVRVADALQFEIVSPESFARGAKRLLSRGYRL